MESKKGLLNKPKLIVIVGPTASGKSALAIKVAKKWNGEIVSADSRQIYRGMDIGTAKAPRNEKLDIKNEESGYYSNKILHHLVDIREPDEEYTVADYKKDAIRAIRCILKKKKLPILAGGTGLYVKAVVDNLKIPEVGPNLALRKKLERRMEKEGLEKLFRELVEFDPEAAYIVDGKNPRRVIRALEIAITTKKPFSAQIKKGERLFDVLTIGVALSPDKLRKRIETRVDEMVNPHTKREYALSAHGLTNSRYGVGVKNGLVNEVNGLIRKYGDEQIAFDAIGYREIIDYLHKKTTLEEAAELIKKNTWAFAKRQMTWFSAKGGSASGGKKDPEIKWINPHTNSGLKKAMRLCEKFLRNS